MKKERNTSSIRDLALGKLSPEESLKVLEKLERNPEASEELDVVADLMNFVAIQGEGLFEREQDAVFVGESSAKRIVWKVEELLRPKKLAYPIAALVVLFVLMSVLVVASALTTSRYYSLTKIDRLEFESRVRGPGLQDFAMAYQSFSESRYDEAIRLLERFIRAFPQSELVDYAHYSAGATYLVSSEQSFLSLFPSFDHERVTRGLEHLELAIQKSSNPRTIEDSRLLRARGYLMLDKSKKAIAELRIVESLNGLKREQASRLISELQEIEKGG
ncbi:MAG: tol-pal system YbgF family protein [Bacteroidota bacterium]